jgi:capsular polysaccharide transport system permease protein
MSNKPRAYRFRIGRQGAPRSLAPPPDAAPPEQEGPGPVEDGFGDRTFPTAGPQPAGGQAAPAAAPDTEDRDIQAIRAEGLTGRQLRMARRVAHKHGIEVKSDFDAVRQLRRRGIDPFRHGNLLQLVVGKDGAKPGDTAPEATPNLPQTVAQPQQLPGPAIGRDIGAEDRRGREIVRVQRDIARRRRRRLAMLFARLALFVFLPTAIAGYYYHRVATPMFATTSEFVIQHAQPQGSGGLGSLFTGTAMATVQDSVTVQSYLQSREAMLRLEGDHGFKAHYTGAGIDPLQRLEHGATNEEAYKLYRRNVKIGYDPTEGVIRMEVIAPSPQLSETFSRALISYAEDQVDHLTQRLRGDQMSGAEANYRAAEENVREAQQRVIELQERRGIMSADAEVSMLMNQIAAFETELRQERLQLLQMMENTAPNTSRVSVSEANIRRLQGLITEMRDEMTKSGVSTESLARITGELMMAEADLETRRMLLAQSLQQMETARIEANRQVRYLSTGVSPVAPDQATYPRAFENTAVAFLIFSGIYLMISLTASILREQVSA